MNFINKIKGAMANQFLSHNHQPDLRNGPRNRCLSFLLFLFLTSYFLLLTSHLSYAGGMVYWTPNGIKLSDKRAYPSDMISDGRGGAIVILDGASINDSIYAQRVDGGGNLLWGSNGMVVTGAGYIGSNGAKAVSDGKGGVIVVWERYSSLTFLNLFAQRLDSTGAMMWNPNGVLICNADSDQCYPAIVSDGSGGAIIAWQDGRNGTTGRWDIYAQRVDSAGNVRWLVNGMAVCTLNTSEQSYPKIAKTWNDDVIITWHDSRQDVFAQKIQGDGSLPWGLSGKPICLASSNQGGPLIVADGIGGAIIAWNDGRNTGTTGIDIYAQRVDSLGNSRWLNDGVSVFKENASQLIRGICSDEHNCAMIVSWDYRNGNYDIYAQEVDSSGFKIWDSTGIPVCIADSTQQSPAITSDTHSGAIIAWQDKRNYSATRWDVYAQHIDSSGTVLWDTNGMAICIAPWSQGGCRTTTDMVGGAIIAWSDERDGSTDKTYAQRVSDEPAEITEKVQDAGYRMQDARLEVYPNLFTVRATIRYYLPKKSVVELSIYNVAGQRIIKLVEECQEFGCYTINLDERLDDFQQLSGGVYFVALKTEKYNLAEKFLFMR